MRCKFSQHRTKHFTTEPWCTAVDRGGTDWSSSFSAALPSLVYSQVREQQRADSLSTKNSSGTSEIMIASGHRMIAEGNLGLGGTCVLLRSDRSLPTAVCNVRD